MARIITTVVLLLSVVGCASSSGSSNAEFIPYNQRQVIYELEPVRVDYRPLAVLTIETTNQAATE